MNFYSNIDHLFEFLIYFSTLTIYVESIYRPLCFDRTTCDLKDLWRITLGDPKVNVELAIACPAEYPYEKTFNLYRSFSKNSLFVRGTYDRDTRRSLVPTDNCADMYKSSIIYHTTFNNFLIGYEVYYDLEKYDGFEQHNNHANYKSVENAYSRVSEISEELELLDDNSNTIKLGFIWLGVTKVKFDNSRKTPIQVTYELSNTTEIGVQCEDYSLGNEIYEQNSIYIDLLYKNQVEIFSKIAIPTKDIGCKKSNTCLIKYSLVPAEQFRFRYPQPMRIPCSNLTTVPIWRSAIYGALQQLDKFLYILARFANENLKVYSGAHGRLKMEHKLRGATEVFLDDKKKIPVSDIIYKVVTYKLIVHDYTVRGTSRRESIFLAVVIVFHNDPQFDPNNALCSEDNFENSGWSEIFNQATSSSSSSQSSLNNIYFCSLNQRIAGLLNIEYERRNWKKLNLTNFPVYKERSMEVIRGNALQAVTIEMRNLHI